MEKTRLEAALENAPETTPKAVDEVRLLEELELLLVGGGGDDGPCW